MLEAEAMRAALHQELRDHAEYLEFGGNEWMCLRHPLVYQIPLMDAEMANKQFEMRTERIKEYEESHDIQGILAFYERPYRAPTLLDLCNRLAIEDRAFWDAMRWVWMDTENMWQCEDDFRILLGSRMETKQMVMNREELNFLRLAPSKIRIYRGTSSGESMDGMSWTTDHDVAEKFAGRFGEKTDGILEVAIVDKGDVFAYINGRGEHEIILLDPKVRRTVHVEVMK